MAAEREAQILVIDDNPQNVALVQAQLERAGYRVTCAESGTAGLDAAERMHPDLILLDVMMPGMDGYQVCEILRRNPSLSAIPIVMLTSLHERTDKLRALDSGADDFLSKPVDRAELMARVRSLLRMKRTYDDLAQSKVEVEQQAHQLAAAKSRAEAILSSMSDGVFVTDERAHITYVNRAVEKITGMAADDCLGRPWYEALSVRDRNGQPIDPRSCPIVQVMKSGAPVPPRELGVWRNDGTEIAISLAAAPVTGVHDKPIGGVAVFRDVTSEREVHRMKEDFVGLVSHELRTPLAAIYGFAELLLQRERLSDTARTFVETMYKEADRMSGLVNDFLDIERLASGRMSFHFRSVQLDEVLAEARESLASQLSQHTIVVDIPKDRVYVRADRDRLVQVLLNLLSNAIKYSPDGGEIRISARPEGREVRISVSDEGLGLPPGAIPKLFQKFYRVEEPAHRKVAGTGLGLAICQQIAEGNGGRIWAESPGIGLGSTFTFTVPLSGIPAHRPASSSIGTAHGRILLAKDDPSIAALILEQLGSIGYAVEAVSSGEDAINHVRAERPAAVVLDVGLTGRLDGWGVMAALRDDPATADIPIIMVSGRDDQDRGMALGVEEFLVKPVPAQRLIACIRRHAGEPGERPVVVADDDPNVRSVVQGMLEDAGFAVVPASDGREALDRLHSCTPLALVLDLVMPEVDGFGVLEEIRADPSLRDLPVVVLTAKNLAPEERDQLNLRTAETLYKPGGTGTEITAAILRAIQVGGSQSTPCSATRRSSPEGTAVPKK